MRVDPQQAGADRSDLAAALRDLRKASGLSGERLARRSGMSQAKISRIETGRALPSTVDVECYLKGLSVDAQTQEELLALARVANAEYQDIRSSARRGLQYRQRELANLEGTATHLRYFLPALITGLLQTPEYMRQALSKPVDPVAASPTRVMTMKLERQAVLQDGGKQFDFLLTESALRWRLCEPVIMAAQVDRLISISKWSNVSVEVIPQVARVPDGPMHGFVIYDNRLVTVELFSGQLVLRDPKEVSYFRALHGFFEGHALSGDEARSFMVKIATAHRAGK